MNERTWRRRKVQFGIGADDRLSRAASLVARMIREASAADGYDEFGGGEFCAYIWRGMITSMREELAAIGYDPAEFVNEVKNRTSAKFVYQAGFDIVLV